MVKYAIIALLACGVVADQECLRGYTDDKCQTADPNAKKCNDLKTTCTKSGDVWEKSSCTATEFISSTYTSKDCTGDKIDKKTTLNDCKAGSMEGFPNVKSYQTTCGACFALDDKALREDGTEVAFGDLKIGDNVLAVDEGGNLVYSKIFRFGDRGESEKRFLRFALDDGSSLDVTSGHYLFANTCCGLDSAIRSDTVKVGDHLFVAKQHDKALRSSVVVGISQVTKAGSVNPHTLHGTIVANGVVATHFTEETTWAKRSWAPLWYKALYYVISRFA